MLPKPPRSQLTECTRLKLSGPVPPLPAAGTPLDYTARLEAAIRHVAANSPPLSYVDPDRLLAGWSQSRVGGDHGIYATIQGLRFEGGNQTSIRGGREFRWPQLTYAGREILYLVLFFMPRFANLPYRAKLTTIFHEMYHVSPVCDGDLRRFPGRNYAHGHSREAYNARLQPWIDSYLEQPGSVEAMAFLTLDFAQIQRRHSSVTGRQLKPLRPKPVR
jgi:hypothetical protein